MYDNIDFGRLFDDQTEYGRKYDLGPFDESRLKDAEAYLGYKLPQSFVEFLKIRNGGQLSEEYSECWLTAIYGLGESKDTAYSIQDVFDEWKNDLGCPDIGVPFGETQSGGHDMFYLDYTVTDENGEPRVVLLDNECGNSMSFVANNFREFIEKVCRKENLIAGTHPIKDEKEAERERIRKELDDIDGNCSLCRGGIFFAIVGLLICLLFKKYILVAVCAVIVAILIPLERRFSKEYDRVKSELPDFEGEKKGR